MAHIGIYWWVYLIGIVAVIAGLLFLWARVLDDSDIKPDP